MPGFETQLKRLRRIKRVAAWTAIGAFFIPCGYMALLMSGTINALGETDAPVPGGMLPAKIADGIASLLQMHTYVMPILLLGIIAYLIASSLERKALYKAVEDRE